jgi:exosortase/archaeosortase
MLRNCKSNLLSDTIALVSFAFVTGVFVEIVISGLTFEQSLQSRLMAIPLNAIVARPYGIYRDRLLMLLKTIKMGISIQIITDILAFMTFMVPQYIAVLCLIGANSQQIVIACITVTTMSLFIGRPYGLYLDFCRKILG